MNNHNETYLVKCDVEPNCKHTDTHTHTSNSCLLGFVRVCETIRKGVTQKHPSYKQAHHQTEPELARAVEAEWISEPSIGSLISIEYWMILVRYALSYA